MSETKTAGSFKDLIAWQKAMRVPELVYKLTATFPSEEKSGLVSQMRRAAVSGPSNIAEGQARPTTGEFVLFFSQAEGSVAELETQPLLAVSLGFATADQSAATLSLLDEVRRMLNALRRSLVTRH
jgi:four helix bundle protein